MTDDEKVRRELLADTINIHLEIATGIDALTADHIRNGRSVYVSGEAALAAMSSYATLIQSQEREVTDAMVEAACRAACKADGDDAEKYWTDYNSNGAMRAALEAAIRSSSPTQEG